MLFRSVLLIAALLPEGAISERLTNTEFLIGGLVGGLLTLPLVAWLIWYAFAGVHGARDLYHLATLETARRGLSATAFGGELNATEAKP